MANHEISQALVFKLEYGNNPEKALEKVKNENFLTYKGLQEKDDTDFAGWGKIHAALDMYGGDKERAGVYLERDYALHKTVMEYYKRKYWDKIRGDELEQQHIADEMLVAAVLYSPLPAIKMAQRVVGVDDDGVLGKDTLAALNSFSVSIFDVAYDKQEIARAEMLARNPRLAWALNGWKNRAVAV